MYFDTTRAAAAVSHLLLNMASRLMDGSVVLKLLLLLESWEGNKTG